MNSVAIHLHEDKTNFQPGETIVGRAAWELSPPPQTVEVRLFWFTDFVGGTEVQVVERRVFENPQGCGQEIFSFQLPRLPYSFHGNLFAVKWAVELVFHPGQEMARAVFVSAPHGVAIAAVAVV